MADFETLRRVTTSYRHTLNAVRSIGFAYTGGTAFEASRGINYTYTGLSPSHTGKTIGWRSDYTQLIANYYQDWNRIRQCQDSTGQYFINTIAMAIEESAEHWKSEQKNLWIDSANILQPWRIYRMGLPSYADLDKQETAQLLYNGGFKFEAVSRYNIPDGWTDNWSYSSGYIALDSTDSVVGGSCVKMRADSGETCYLSQKQDLLVPKNQQLCFSVWYKTIDDPSYSTVSVVKPLLKAAVLQNDYTTLVHELELKRATSGVWVRDYLVFSGLQDIAAVTVGIHLENTGTTTGNNFYFDAAKLELGDYPTQWEHNIIDSPEWMKHQDEFFAPSVSVEMWGVTGYATGNITGYSVTGLVNQKIPFFYIPEAQKLLTNDLVPTRISWQVTTGSDIGLSNSVYGLFVNNIDTIPQEKGWRIVNSTGLQTYAWPHTDDTGIVYGIADPNIVKRTLPNTKNVFDIYSRYTVSATDLQQTGAYGYSISYDAFTIKDDKIWLFAQEVYNGETATYLKILSPKAEYNKRYLELIKDYKLENFSGRITSAGFLETDPPRMAVTYTGNVLTSGAIIDLSYDYYTIDRKNRQVYFRGPVPNLGYQMVVI